jgi:hypothetical protein
LISSDPLRLLISRSRPYDGWPPDASCSPTKKWPRPGIDSFVLRGTLRRRSRETIIVRRRGSRAVALIPAGELAGLIERSEAPISLALSLQGLMEVTSNSGVAVTAD